MTKKPQPWYASLTQQSRSIRNGNNRRTSPPVHGNPADRASNSAGRTDPGFTITGRIVTRDTSRLARLTADARPIPSAGIRTGELTAYRAWYVINDHQLRSLAHYFIWEPGVVVEGDVNAPIIFGQFALMFPPVMGGVYAYKTVDDPSSELHHVWNGKFPRREERDEDGWGNFRRLARAGWGPLQPVGADASVTLDEYLGMAIGTVKLWGEVVEHERGYRAQYAKLASIDQVCGVVEPSKLRKKYGVWP